MRYHIDIAYFATCCCVVGLAFERYVLICRYNEAKILLTKGVRIKFLLLSVLLTALPIVLKVLERGQGEPWLREVRTYCNHPPGTLIK